MGRVSLLFMVFFVFANFRGKTAAKFTFVTSGQSHRTVFKKLSRRSVDFSCAPPYARLFISSAAALLEDVSRKKLLSHPTANPRRILDRRLCQSRPAHHSSVVWRE